MGDLCTTEDSKSVKQEYLDSLPSMHLEPLWDRLSSMVPASPNPVCVPYLWEYEKTLPFLSKAGKMVPEEEAERRVLMLVNPSMKAPHTTDTIYGGLQLVNPGETAPAHRHIAFACRFIIEGRGFTAVEGKKLPLARGDIVLTPSWHWHDHGNESDWPVIWLDALNLPLFTFARVNFAEGYNDKRYPSTLQESADWLYPWAGTKQELDGQKKSHAVYHYTTSDGKPISTTIGAQAERLDCEVKTNVSQHPSSFLYHCYEGYGHSVITAPNGLVYTLQWTCRDTFAVPSWSKVQHVNKSATDPAYLVAIHDGPLLSNLGLLRPGI